MHLPRNMRLCRTAGVVLAPVLALVVASSCSTISIAQVLTINDLAYATVTNDDDSSATLRLDLWKSTNNNERAPLVIWIHGGAWLGGSYNGTP
jgi:carboxylesterase type B